MRDIFILNEVRAQDETYLEFGCLCPAVVHNDYVVLDQGWGTAAF
jgi:hypothetical protein